MQRKLAIPLIGLLLLLAVAVAFLAIRGRPSPPPILLDEAGGNATNPYQAELDCIDRVIQRNDMDANEVQPALATCRGAGGPGNESMEQ
jgi:hypothetical protein